MSYQDLRFFPTRSERHIDKYVDPTEFSGEPRVTQETSLLVDHTAEKVCLTCDFSDLCADNGGNGIYVICQNPNSPIPLRPHNALYGCDAHSEI